MNVARILYPVKVLGPGTRIGIWLTGCPRRCHGCSNPELWEMQPQYEISVDRLVQMIAPIWTVGEASGFTITGGDPLWQTEELSVFLKRIVGWTEDILVYTGYRKADLDASKNPAIRSCLDNIGVLIDEPYVESKNDGARMRGSSNQNIFILKPALAKRYEEYLENGKNEIQNFMTQDGMVSVGIHRPGFQQEIVREARKKGVILHE